MVRHHDAPLIHVISNGVRIGRGHRCVRDLHVIYHTLAGCWWSSNSGKLKALDLSQVKRVQQHIYRPTTTWLSNSWRMRERVKKTKTTTTPRWWWWWRESRRFFGQDKKYTKNDLKYSKKTKRERPKMMMKGFEFFLNNNCALTDELVSYSRINIYDLLERRLC